MQEITPSDRTNFVLLADFWEAYNTFELKQATSIPEINGTIRSTVRAALKNAVGSFESISPKSLRTRIDSSITENAYVVTLDGGCIFNNFDYSIEITRACTSIKHAHVGPYIRMPRPLAAQLSQQFLNLKANFEKSQKKFVVLCDDGIGTGSTIKRILKGMNDVGIMVDEIVAITNPNAIESLEGIPIKTIYSAGQDYNWLNERDLYWGLPRSGLSTCANNSFVGTGGIPYTINRDMVVSRIGISSDKAEVFRLACIDANMTFWKILEKFNGRRLEIRDCGRLSFFADKYGEAAEVINILNESKHNDILATV